MSISIFRIIKILRGKSTYSMDPKQETTLSRFLLIAGIVIGAASVAVVLL